MLELLSRGLLGEMSLVYWRPAYYGRMHCWTAAEDHWMEFEHVELLLAVDFSQGFVEVQE